MGGVAGHAGVFTTALDLSNFAELMLLRRLQADADAGSASEGDSEVGADTGRARNTVDDAERSVSVDSNQPATAANGAAGVAPRAYLSESFLNASTVKLFTTVVDEAQSSRALGWSTNSFAAEDYGYDHSCGTMTAETFMHTGYTGTCMCIDPGNQIYTVILTNRLGLAFRIVQALG